DASRYSPTQAAKTSRVLQEFNCLSQFRPRFVNTGNVFEAHALFAALIFKIERTTAIHARVNLPPGKSKKSQTKERECPIQYGSNDAGLQRSEFNRHVALAKRLNDFMLCSLASDNGFHQSAIQLLHRQRFALDRQTRDSRRACQ